jgi:hypothetical protein
MHQQCPLSTAYSCSNFPPHARFMRECAPLMKKWNGACPAYYYYVCTPAPHMLHATIVPTCHARTHASAHHMPVDAHVGGNRATCLLTHHMPASLVVHVRTATPTRTASACARFLRLLMLLHEALLQHTSKTGETFTNIGLQHMCIAITTFR